ncbi:serine hydrolase domain-containing protein [Actinoplanes ianthinogenes]|uniref:serine hydrolase domain-containing protein n=1 Tax=Actinoplanes ianthinogenes TaxID=122358 RepID=UPI0016701A08|nr:serine hydrolase domain-containing protein [Actinoplanes ianthinogenes]
MDRGLAQRATALIESAGYGDGDRVVVGLRHGDAPAVYVSHGEPFTTACVASVSKQITAACVALLVRQGQLDVESALARWIPELPAWAATVRVRHLIHHTGGLPEAGEFFALKKAGRDRTVHGMLAELAGHESLESIPGTAFSYRNPGYACLSVIVERVASEPFPDFARSRLFEPLGMAATGYWPGPEPFPPGTTPTELGSPAPLSLGDCGVWSTAADLMRWNEALAADELGVSGLLHTAGRLDDGPPLPYGWGVDVLTRAGFPLHRHGGVWAGLSAEIARLPAQRAAMVVIALDHAEARTKRLADSVIDDLIARGETSAGQRRSAAT